MPTKSVRPAQHPEDSIIVRNINVDDPDFKEYFQVTWNKILFRIPPGQTRRLPRYLAEHFCKHMTDRIIFRMDMAQFGRKLKTSRLRDTKLRNEIRSRCLIAVDQYYMADESDPQEQLKRLYGQLNPEDQEGAISLGTVDIEFEPPSIKDIKTDESGNPVLDKIIPVANDEKGVGEVEKEKMPARRPKVELIAEAEELGIELEGNESAEDIQELLLAY